MQEEEAREPEPADHPQLLLEPPLRLRALAGAGVAELEAAAADLGQGAVGLGILRAGVAIAELVAEVEAQPLGEPRRLGDGLGVVGEAGRHLRRRGEHRARVAAPLGLALLERRVRAHGDERVLELGPARGRGRGRCRWRRCATPSSSASSASRRLRARSRRQKRPLELDPEALAPEARQQPARERLGPPRLAALPAPGHGAVAGAAGEADEPLVALEQRSERQRGGEGVAIDLRARLGVRLGQQATEVVPAGRALDQKREVKAAGAVERGRCRCDGELGADDRAHAEALARLGELHRPAEVVVVGERERLVAVLGGADRQLLRQRGAVEERVGGVGVQLDVHASRPSARTSARPRRSAGSRKTTSRGRRRAPARNSVFAGVSASTSDPRPASPRAPPRPRSPATARGTPAPSASTSSGRGQ